jgi:hypothetical protein
LTSPHFSRHRGKLPLSTQALQSNNTSTMTMMMKKNVLCVLFLVAACFASTTSAKPDKDSQEGEVRQMNDPTVITTEDPAADKQEVMIGDTKVTISGADPNQVPAATQGETSEATVAAAQQYAVGLLVGVGAFSLASLM